MTNPKLTFDARCLIIRAARVLEQCIEDRGREIAVSRASAEISPQDIRRATAEFFQENLEGLPHLVEEALNEYGNQLSKAA